MHDHHPHPPSCLPHHVLIVVVQITSGQVRYLRKLGVPKSTTDTLSKSAASNLITKKLQEREMQPPTGPQLQLLAVSRAAPSTVAHR